jgi:hypothetical protein
MKQASQPVAARTHGARLRRSAVTAVSKPSWTCSYTALSLGSGAIDCCRDIPYSAAIGWCWKPCAPVRGAGRPAGARTNNPVV